MSKIYIYLCLGREINCLNSNSHPCNRKRSIHAMFTSRCKTLVCQTRSRAAGAALAALPPAVVPPGRPAALSFSNVGGCSLAPLSKASQGKELALQTGPITAVCSTAGATEHPWQIKRATQLQNKAFRA